ncbi:flavin reductase family protein [Glaciecola siphonariae]|uniref:Flavin reductase family protein n=1 Tax=Glaciecola siphonariae TaxID=521012 RepID=A0ABV9LR18_9ALTE
MHVTKEQIAGMGKFERANFINSLSGMKSANLIGTKSEHGVTNLALVSSVFHVGANPPLVGMLMRPHTVVRDTLQNIKDSGVYTINHVNEAMVEQAHQCSARYDSDKSEFEATGLEEQYFNDFAAPFVAQSNIKFAVEVREIQVLQLNQTELVIGEIVGVLSNKDYCLEDGYVDIQAAGSIAVSSLDSYHRTERIDRYSYAKPDEPLRSIWKTQS